ncbi:MAG: mannose-phosphate guanylyltransferase [Marmoricola sp.]|jgi:mannose-1-phosphate guanylyltransferase|nr:mannose-phosphate guanylyltransferase [Marmoricola sp.]
METPEAMTQFWAVVPAGGAGTRLWPLSRASSPKFLHDLTGSGRTLIQATIDRLAPLVDDRVLVITGAAHEDAVRRQLPALDRDRVIAEPSPRDSMAAIGLAAALLERDDPDAVLGSFAADHVISDQAAFEAGVREAVSVAQTGVLVTIGIEPTFAATGFGYIRAGVALAGFETACTVKEFVEKPDAERAAGYVASGEYRWNGGMFVVRASVLLDLLAENHPDLAAGLRAIAADPARLGELWPDLEKIAIDHAVAEPAAVAGRVAVVPGRFGWDDIGDYASLGSIVDAAPDGIRVLGEDALVIRKDASGLVIPAAGRTIAVVGLENIVVVDTGDALLVTTYEHAQDVKAVVDALKQSGRADLT